MTLETLRIVRNPDAEAYSYDITMIDEVDGTQRKPALSISSPGTPAGDNFLLGIQGMEADIPVRWRIHNDGTDKTQRHGRERRVLPERRGGHAHRTDTLDSGGDSLAIL